ncbi:hypothetical protein D0T84_17465 [Dysgonomonas sp. 521]|uniref:hypothetical protein n=1 Tax=Dysgonomonas sp. 521 TaxID=2302932 RepID=UPI0013D0FFD3|nr:hypothetical protein [Dysgonomonas sp. 521]NDV96688.1 hypothetical protein [Dysgonomonas sp. 521]
MEKYNESDIKTIFLMDGTVKGIIQAIHGFAKKNDIEIEVLSDDVLEHEGFIIIASVMGDSFTFGGALKITICLILSMQHRRSFVKN